MKFYCLHSHVNVVRGYLPAFGINELHTFENRDTRVRGLSYPVVIEISNHMEQIDPRVRQILNDGGATWISIDDSYLRVRRGREYQQEYVK